MLTVMLTSGTASLTTNIIRTHATAVMPTPMCRPESNMLKILPKMLSEFLKILTHYALRDQCSHYACIMLLG